MAFFAAFLGLDVAGAGAPPPSVPVQGEIGVTRPCVVFGGKIGFAGLGFAPETPVEVFLSSGRYSLPGTEPEKTVRSSVGGEIHGFLRTPQAGGGKREWVRRAIFASGLNRGGRHESQSFDLVVVGTGPVCRVLDREGS